MTSEPWVFRATDEQATATLGRALADCAPVGGVIALDGVLGAGKTRLVQAVSQASGVDRRDVVSPTFVLVHEYQGRVPIIHIDAYRIRDDDEFLQIGAEEYFQPPNLVLVEWASRVETCLPDDRLTITITVQDDDARHFRVRASGPAHRAIVDCLRQTFGDEATATE